MTTATRNGAMSLGERELDLLDRYWRAANDLSVGQIHLLDNPLLREPLSLDHIKPRLLGHWGTTPFPSLASRASGLRQQTVDERLRHRAYTRQVGDDPPDVRDWTWNADRETDRATGA